MGISHFSNKGELATSLIRSKISFHGNDVLAEQVTEVLHEEYGVQILE